MVTPALKITSYMFSFDVFVPFVAAFKAAATKAVASALPCLQGNGPAQMRRACGVWPIHVVIELIWILQRGCEQYRLCRYM